MHNDIKVGDRVNFIGVSWAKNGKVVEIFPPNKLIPGETAYIVDFKGVEKRLKRSEIKKVSENTMKKNKLSLKELAMQVQKEQDEMPIQPKLSAKQFQESVAQFNSVGKSLYRNESLSELAQKLSDICEAAEHYALNESDDWFDGVTIKRNMKELKGYANEFQKIAEETDRAQQRLAALYEDAGRVLSRYFEVKEEQEMQNEAKPTSDAEKQQLAHAYKIMSAVKDGTSLDTGGMSAAEAKAIIKKHTGKDYTSK